MGRAEGARSYRAFGLSIASDLELPELAAARGAAEVRIVRGHVEPPGDGPPLRVRDGTIDLCYRDVARYSVRGGREVVVDADPAAPAHVVRLYLLGPALGALLHQRGRLLLHASCVAAAGGAVAFLGASGAGKSTIAAAFAARGHAVLADDVLAVEMRPDGVLALPGYPQLKLDPATAARLGREDAGARALHPLDGRRGFPLGREADARPLLRIHLLADGPGPAVREVPAHLAPMELIRHCYPVRVLGPPAARAHFAQAASLASRMAVRRLERPRDLAGIDALLDRVLDDVA